MTKVYSLHRNRAVAAFDLRIGNDFRPQHLTAAAATVFAYLEDRARFANGPQLPAEMRLYEVRLRLEAGRITREELLVGRKARA